jgi:hypothetical protein
VPTIRVVAETSLSPTVVLNAAHDFSERRAEIFPAVELEHFEVHELGTTSADVTEGTHTGPFGTNWERCRYGWSEPNAVRAQVTDSNVYEPSGSSWEIVATPQGSGTRVGMTWVRQFQRGARGRIFGTAFRLVGKPLFGRYARQVLKNLETLEAAGLRE